MRTTNKRGRRQRGFTLIEVLLVLVILAILASMATVFVRRARETGLRNAARTQIGIFESAIDLYELDMQSYPSTSAGLESLIAPPSDATNSNTWNGPYLKESQIPLDPWQNPYQYQLANQDSYVITSMGPDRTSGTADDISSQN